MPQYFPRSAPNKYQKLKLTLAARDIAGYEPWRGNVLKMLRGPLDKILPGSSNASVLSSSRPGSSAATMISVPAAGTSVMSELA